MSRETMIIFQVFCKQMIQSGSTHQDIADCINQFCRDQDEELRMSLLAILFTFD